MASLDYFVQRYVFANAIHCLERAILINHLRQYQVFRPRDKTPQFKFKVGSGHIARKEYEAHSLICGDDFPAQNTALAGLSRGQSKHDGVGSLIKEGSLQALKQSSCTKSSVRMIRFIIEISMRNHLT